MPPLTSANYPLRIAELPGSDGMIDITLAPGKQQDGMSGRHAHDMTVDLDHVAGWNAGLVVTLVEEHELAALGIAGLGAEVRRRHIQWRHWPSRNTRFPARRSRPCGRGTRRWCGPCWPAVAGC